MRIEGKKEPDKSVASRKSAGKEKVSVKGEHDFPDLLREYQPVNWEEDLQQLLKRLDEIGQRLSNSFSIYDLREYKDTLRNFLKDTSGKAYHLKNETGWTRQGRPKLYQSLELIDQELENLSKSVLSGEKDRLIILNRLDQIRGLMVDLYS